MKKLLAILILIVSMSNISFSQSLEETLSNLSSDAATAYVEPVISSFGSNMNSGWVSGVPSASLLGINIKLKIMAVGSFFPDDKRTFITSGQFNYTTQQADEILQASNITTSNPNYNTIRNAILEQTWNVNISGPTINGSENDFVQIEFPGAQIQGEVIGNHITTLDGVKGFLNNLSLLPTPAIQLDIGNVAGTGVSIRYFPDINIEELGKFSLWGAGILHNPGFWLSNPLPVDIGLGFFYQKLDVGNIFENQSFQFGAYVSKTLGVIVTFTPYAGVTYETSQTTLNYTYTFDTPAGTQNADVSFDLDGDNTVGLTIGGTLSLPVVSINVDYKLANISALTAGIAFGF